MVLGPLVRALGQRFREFARLVGTFFWGYVRWVLLPPFVALGAMFALREVLPRSWRGVVIVAALLPTWALTAIWAVRLGDLSFAAAAGLSAMCAFFFAIGALQYFKARQSAGEPLAEVLAQFERVALPAGYWQQRVRERVRLEVETSR